jgi:hypothetical protein
MGNIDRKHALLMAQMWLLDNFDGYGLHYLAMPH